MNLLEGILFASESKLVVTRDQRNISLADIMSHEPESIKCVLQEIINLDYSR